jgi:DNA-binding SARP family transcriptional activator
MEFRILGPLDVVGPDGPIGIDGGKVRALLELLLLHANEVIPGDRLVDSLWGESPSESAEHAVEVYVSRLRRALGQDRIETHPPGYRIRVEPGELDLHRFEVLTAEARAASEANDAAEAVRLLQQAEALWRGPALSELRSLERSRPEIIRMDELRLAAATDRIDAMLATGRHAEVVPELEQLVVEHPFQERLRAQHMLALYRSGRQVDALQAYQVARRVLEEDLGLEPGPALQQLQVAILRQDPELRAAGWLPPQSAPAGETTAAPMPSTTGPARASDRRRRLATVLTAAIVVVAGGAVLVRTIADNGFAQSTSPAGGAVIPSGSGGSPGPSGPLTLDDEKLLDQLPAAIKPHCIPVALSEEAIGNSANLFCDLPLIAEADEVWFHRFSAPGLLANAFNDIAERSDVPAGECSETMSRAIGTWEIPDVRMGRVLCFEADGAVWIVWTSEADRILGRARREGSEWRELYRWWRETRRFLR